MFQLAVYLSSATLSSCGWLNFESVTFDSESQSESRSNSTETDDNTATEATANDTETVINKGIETESETFGADTNTLPVDTVSIDTTTATTSVETNIDSTAPAETDSDSVLNSSTDPDTDSSTGIDTGLDTGADTGIDTGSDTGIDSGADTGIDSGIDTGIDTDSDTESGTVSGSDSDTVSDSETATDSDTQCVAEDPPTDMTESITGFWEEMIGGLEGSTGARPVSASVLTIPNLIWEQLLATDGNLQYCIRWESTGTITSAQRDNIEAALEQWTNHWLNSLDSYDCWPISNISVSISGVAVSNRNLALWDDSEMPVYVGDYREGAPQCPEACGRFFHQDGDFSLCPNGVDARYDMSLWLTDGFLYDLGADWGQRINSGWFLSVVSDQTCPRWLKTLGYGLGFNNFSNWNDWFPAVVPPMSIMNISAVNGGQVTDVTDWDRAMLRYTWDNIRLRY